MDRQKLMQKTADEVYAEVQKMVGKTASRFEKRLKHEQLVVASYASAFFMGMLGVLTYGRKIKGQFKNIKEGDHFNIKNRKDVIRATSEDACVLMSGFLSGLDPDYNYEIQILKKNKK